MGGACGKRRDHVSLLPFAAGAAAFAWGLAAGGIPFGLAALALAVALWVLWLNAQGRWPQALLIALLGAPLVWHVLVEIPTAERLVRQAAPGATLRASGVVREVQSIPAQGGRVTRVLLGRAELLRVEQPGLSASPIERAALAEVELRLPVRVPEWGSLRREAVVGGVPRFTEREGGRLVIRLDAAAWHFDAPPIGRAEVLRAQLSQRAGYYLPHRTLAVYLPVLLGVRDRESPEGRRIAQAFNRVGVAHLFSISGLHVGLLFVILIAFGRYARGLTLPSASGGQGWVHAALATRLAAAAAIWVYVALIGFPIPAVRAAAMGSMVVAGQLWGTRTSPFYLLCVTALGMLAFDPTQLYDLSFQLSFLAYAFLLAALALWERRPRAEERGTWTARLLGGAALNLLVTFWITAGLWPLVAHVFDRVSLLVFAGNLLLVPLMGSVVMPAGLAALATSFACLGTPPGAPLGGLVERAVFTVLGAVLDLWTALAEFLDQAGGALVFDVTLDWPPHVWLLYYASVGAVHAACLWGMARWIPSHRARSEGDVNISGDMS